MLGPQTSFQTEKRREKKKRKKEKKPQREINKSRGEEGEKNIIFKFKQ